MGAPEPLPLTIANASVPAALMGQPNSGALTKVDIVIDRGVIAAINPGGSPPVEGERIDADSGLVLPCFADIHTHLDKGHIWPRKENPDGTWLGALNAVMADRDVHWAISDVERRMEFSLRCAYAHGTAAIRTHLDYAKPQLAATWDLFERMRERWAGRIELQAVAIVGPADLVIPEVLDTVARQTKKSGGLMGGSIGVHPEARKILFAVVEKAGELGIGLDLHIDETLDPDASALRHYADAVVETGFAGPRVAGHCCVLSVQDELTAKATIDRAAEARIDVVSLPMCNIYLQDRNNPAGVVRTPRYRGVTLLSELRAAGVRVAIASDNTRDPFYAYGDLDMVEVFREGARIAHLDHPQADAWTWSRAVGAGAAGIAGFAHKAEIAVGSPADLVLFRARTWTELHSRPQSDRYILRNGSPIDTTPPDYRELDDLFQG